MLTHLIDTDNPLEEPYMYQNITLAKDFGRADIELLRKVEQLSPSTSVADTFDALIIAIHQIDITCKRLKYQKNIYFITDASGEMFLGEDVEIVKNQLINSNILLNLM